MGRGCVGRGCGRAGRGCGGMTGRGGKGEGARHGENTTAPRGRRLPGLAAQKWLGRGADTRGVTGTRRGPRGGGARREGGGGGALSVGCAWAHRRSARKVITAFEPRCVPQFPLSTGTSRAAAAGQRWEILGHMCGLCQVLQPGAAPSDPALQRECLR